MIASELAVQPRTKRVLLVEDDEAQRAAMTRALAKAGFEVAVAADGAGAVVAAREIHPDAVVIDVFLPDAGGLGVARALRAELDAFPVLFVTGLAITGVREALAPVLFKPFGKKQLLAGVRRITGAV